MNRLRFREVAFLCAPIVLIAGAFLIPLLRHPPKDPNAIIALSVQSVPSRISYSSSSPTVNFAWEAKAVGGPQDGYRFGYWQQIVSISKAGEKVIFAQPGKGSTLSSITSGGGGYTPGQFATVSQDIQVDVNSVPVNATRLEWRGEVVAVPKKSGSTSSPASALQLQKWARMKGAARAVKTVPLAFDPAKNAIAGFGLEPVNPTNAALGADTCVVVKLRDEPRRICRRVVAFDGRTRRVLWDDNSNGRNLYWQSTQGQYLMGLKRDDLLFHLRKVPREWGQITFLEDVVFVAHSDPSQPNEKTTDIKTIDALEKAGNVRFSRRVVLRPEGATISVPKFQKTPNLRFNSLKVQKDAKGTHLLVSVNYTGHNLSPQIDVPDSVAVFDPVKNSNGDYVKSYELKTGPKADEWMLVIDLRSLQKAPRRLRLETDVADDEAAPLHIARNFELPIS